MITNGGYHYLEAKKLFALLRGITSKKVGDFHFLNCFYSFKIKLKLQPYKKYAKTKIFVVLQCRPKAV